MINRDKYRLAVGIYTGYCLTDEHATVMGLIQGYYSIRSMRIHKITKYERIIRKSRMLVSRPVKVLAIFTDKDWKRYSKCKLEGRDTTYLLVLFGTQSYPKWYSCE